MSLSDKIAVRDFDKVLGEVADDGIVNQNDLNDIFARMHEASQLGCMPISADVISDGAVTSIDSTLPTWLTGRKLAPRLFLD